MLLFSGFTSFCCKKFIAIKLKEIKASSELEKQTFSFLLFLFHV